MIAGVRVVPLLQIADERGSVLRMVRRTDEHFVGFGEIYFSRARPGAVKGWNVHRSLTANLAVVCGRARLVLVDRRDGSATAGAVQELELGEERHLLVQVPPGIAIGYTALGGAPAVVANCATEPHRPEEVVRIDPFGGEIDYPWNGASGGETAAGDGPN